MIRLNVQRKWKVILNKLMQYITSSAESERRQFSTDKANHTAVIILSFYAGKTAHTRISVGEECDEVQVRSLCVYVVTSHG